MQPLALQIEKLTMDLSKKTETTYTTIWPTNVLDQYPKPFRQWLAPLSGSCRCRWKLITPKVFLWCYPIHGTPNRPGCNLCHGLVDFGSNLGKAAGHLNPRSGYGTLFLEGKENTLETQIVAEANLESIVTSHVELRHHTEREFE